MADGPGHIPGPINGEPGETWYLNGEPGEDPRYGDRFRDVSRWGSPTIGQLRQSPTWRDDLSAGWVDLGGDHLVGQGAVVSAGVFPPSVPDEVRYRLSQRGEEVSRDLSPPRWWTSTGEDEERKLATWKKYEEPTRRLGNEVVQALVAAEVEPGFKLFEDSNYRKGAKPLAVGWPLNESEVSDTRYISLLLSNGCPVEYTEPTELQSRSFRIYKFHLDKLSHPFVFPRTAEQWVMGSVYFQNGQKLSPFPKQSHGLGAYMGELQGLSERHDLNIDVSPARLTQMP
jgi:hypothetical protein